MKYYYTILLAFMLLLGGGAKAQDTWYTLASGDWDNPDIWTLDPAGAVPVGSAVPSVGDNVIILTGKTVVVPDGNAPYDSPSVRDVTLDLGKVKVIGQLDLRKSGGHEFTELSGSGRLLMAEDNYPLVGDASKFVDAGEDEGTCVYYGDSNFDIRSASTFYNLEIDMDAGNRVILREDYLLNGNLLVKSGQVRIGRNNTVRYTINIKGDITINNGAQLRVVNGRSFGDTEDDYHQIICYGDFTNNGTVRLTNQSAPDYDTRLTGDGVAAAVLTMSGTSDASFTCNGTTNLYRLIVDKGSDQTYIVNLSASSEGNFRLYGCNNQNGVDTKALYLKNGTLELSGAIFIPTLTEGGSDFYIGSTAGLHLNGGGVKVYSTARSNAETNVGGVVGTGVVASGGSQSFSVLGKFKITDGLFETKSHGFVVWDSGNASVQVEGGTVVTPGFRSAGGQTGKWSYNQSGGLVQLYGDIDSDLYWSGSPTFHIKGSENVFMMSGGTMEIFDAATSSQLAIGIESGEGNYLVTGGTIKVNRDAAGSSNFNISSSAPLYNLEITSSNSQSVLINTALRVENNLTIAVNSTFSTSNHTLEIGGDFSNNGTFSTGSSHTTRFVGTNVSTVSGGTITFDNLELEKEDVASTVTMGSGTIAITRDLLIEKGTLDVGSLDRNLSGNIDISYGDITGSGALVLNSSGSAQTLKGKVGQNPLFGNIKLNNTNGSSPQIVLLSNVDANSFHFERNQIVELDKYNLEIVSSLSKDGSLDWNYNECMFRTTGLSSDGGLTLPISLSGDYSDNSVQYFPVGLFDASSTPNDRFTPFEVFANGTGLNTTGSITMIPVNGDHPTTDPSATVLPFYWSVKYTGLSGITKDNLMYYFTYDKSLSNGFEKNGSVLTGASWAEFSGVRDNNDLTFKFPYAAELSKDFTLGKANDYNFVVTLYSRRSGTWSSTSTWSLDSHTGDEIPSSAYLPLDGDRVIIGNGHTVNVAYDGSGGYNTEAAGEVIFDHDTTVSHGIEDLPRLQIERGNTMNLNRVSGTGIITQWLDNSRDPVITGDLGDFINQKYSWFLFVANSGQVDIPEIFDIYPNVMTEGSGNVLTFTNDIVINRDLNPRGNSIIRMNNGSNGDITVGGDLLLGDWNHGVLEFDDDGTERVLTIEGNIDFTSSVTTPNNTRQLRVRNATPNDLEHQIYLSRDIIQGPGVIDLANTGATDNSVIITFVGDQSASVSKTASEITDFYRLEIDKALGTKVHFLNSFTLSGDATMAIKPINLLSGQCHLDNSDIDINLSTGGNNFKIPTGSSLKVSNSSTVNISGNSGIWLDDALIIDGGIANIDGTVAGSTSSGSSFIEYTASGNSRIDISVGGVLNVGSQIRRSINTEEGSLQFAQNTGTVKVGTVAGGYQSTRGVFEILGANSSFTQAAGDNITLVRGQGENNNALYFDPETSTIGTGAGFTFGDNTTPASQSMVIFAGKELGDITVSGTNAPTAILNIVPATLNGDLTINNGTFNTNGLDVTLKGNFTKNASATYMANGNTTYFEGGSDQTILGTPTFANLTKQIGAGSLILGASSPITVAGDLSLNSGTVNTGANDLTVYGDVINDITTLGSGATQGVVMAGADAQELGGSGTFYRLTINNPNGVVLPTQSGSVTFSDYLKLQDGVFDIGRNLLVIEEAASIEGNGTGTPFSETNMIQTNLSFVDNGIQKFFPEVTSGTVTFTYPIGSLGKYTPVVLDITGKSANSGSIRVKAADEPHLSVPIADQDEVLQYNWTLDANGIEDFKADAYMYFYESDAHPSYGDTTQYETGRILLSSIDWNKYGVDDFHGGSGKNYLRFRFGSVATGTDDIGIDGDYTAGAALPDQVPAYISVTDGSWTTTATWATYDPSDGTTGSAGVGVPASGPRGAVVYIDNTVDLPSNFMAAYRTYINATGIVDVGTSFGHRLGDVFGVGTLKVMSGDLPAGYYDDFFSATGGTLEYTGSNNYDILSEVTSLNNLVLSGTGERRLPNINFQILGDLTMSGADVVNTHNRNMSIKGNVSFTGGTFDAGTTVGARIPTLTMNGDVMQSISGSQDFTSSNALYDFKVNCAVGVEVNNNIEVDDVLRLTKGIIYSDAGGSLTITKSTADAFVGGSSTAYVQGPLRKNIVGGDSFTFPLGDASRYGELIVAPDASSSGIWEAQYYNQNPLNNAGRPMDPNTDGTVAFVSHNEYWRAEKDVASGNADLTLRWDSSSGVQANTDFRVVQWTNANNAWRVVSGSGYTDNNTSGFATRTLSLNQFAGEGNYVTFGAVSTPPYTWLGNNSNWFDTSNWAGTALPGAGANITIGATSNDPIVNETSVAQVNNLTISATASLTLQEGAQMTVNGELVTNDKLLIKNTNAKPASFITYDSNVVGNVTVEWTYDNQRWWLIGHAISNAQMASYDALTPANDYALFDFQDPDVMQRISKTAYDFSAQDEIRGYLFKVKNSGAQVTHIGALNDNTEYSKPLQTEWQVIANPYSSYYQLPKETGGGADFANTTGSVYVTISSSNQDKTYETFNTLTGISSPETFNGIIAPSQGFYVETASAGNVYMRAAHKVHDGAKTSLKSGKSEDKNILRIKLSNDSELTDEAVVALMEEGSTAYSRMDSEQRFVSGNAISYIYSLINDKKAVINVLPDVVDGHQVNLGLKAKVGEHKMQISGLESLIDTYELVLEDKLFETSTIMMAETEYVFSTEEGDFDSRFVLHFNKIEVPTGIDDVETGKNETGVIIYIEEESILNVSCSWEEREKSVEVFTISGQKVFSKAFEGDSFVENIPYKSGVYIVRVIGNNKTSEHKVFIK